LAEKAAADRAYIRPIALFQAQPKDQEVTVERLKTHLIEVERIPDERIAVATGDQRELDGLNLFDPACPIEHVITIEALKEGWDCSFAYVFCSVSRIQSAVDVEQLLGRVLRMPYAERREASELNRAYAFLSEPSFGEAARALTDKLVAMGFEEAEARDNIEPVQEQLGDDDLFAQRSKPKPVFRHSVPMTPALRSTIERNADARLRIHDTEDGRLEIAVTGRLDGAIERAIADALPVRERERFTEAASVYRLDTQDQLSPAEQGEAFTVPRLMTAIQGELEFADSDIFMEFHDWSLLDHSAKLSAAEFDIRETARSFEIDLDGNHVTYQFADEEEQLALDIAVEGWTPEALVLWLDRQSRQPDMHQSELLRWLRELVDHLIKARGMHIAALMRCKFILARKIRDRLDGIRRGHRSDAYQKYLFEPDAEVDVSFDHGFAFREGMYRDVRRYHGRWKPRKHFLGPDAVPVFDGADNGEEFQCAQAIDSLSDVKFWLRNVAKHPASFWLPTASGRFYPDFVAQLEDGRLLVVEYKGDHLKDSIETGEKRTIGELWERSSDGRGLFHIAEKDVDGLDVRAQLMEKIEARPVS
ncbi:MAG: restriction endonuclease subunit R, partial [Rhodospirillales bacterium]|nr:restriction endonuclease subunit R [Rhodospirillales bacterium]